jgi:hypothetical protein
MPQSQVPTGAWVQEMSRTRDARVIVADGLPAPAGQLGVVQVHVRLHEFAQVGLAGRLVLRRQRHDIPATVGQPGVQRGGARHLLLDPRTGGQDAPSMAYVPG